VSRAISIGNPKRDPEILACFASFAVKYSGSIRGPLGGMAVEEKH